MMIRNIGQNNVKNYFIKNICRPFQQELLPIPVKSAAFANKICCPNE
jgi:hypothetical protein